MGLSKSTTTDTDIDYIDTRDSLYYNKYEYRARFYCEGLSLLYWCKSVEDIEPRHETIVYHNKRYNDANIPLLKKFFIWKSENCKKGSGISVRIEGGIAAAFSNDLTKLKTLKDLGGIVDFTKINNTVPEGIKYFKSEPPYKYRLILKTKRVKEGFALRLSDWIDRYKGTKSEVYPNRPLNDWLIEAKYQHLNPNGRHKWRLLWSSSHFAIHCNDESMFTLFALIFEGMTYKKFKLLKRPS